MGQIYTRERYLTRGRFSRAEFRVHLPGRVRGDLPGRVRGFLVLSISVGGLLAAAVPVRPRANLLYAFKAPEDSHGQGVSVARALRGARAGTENPSFSERRSCSRTPFWGRWKPTGGRWPALIFEFGTFSQRSYCRRGEFLADLDKFLGALPKPWRYSVEIRNPEYLTAPSTSTACGRTAWRTCSTPGRACRRSIARSAMPGAFTADFSVCRALLSRGRSYEQAVKTFSSPTRKCRTPTRRPARRCGPLIAGRGATEPAGLCLRKQPAGRQRA